MIVRIATAVSVFAVLAGMVATPLQAQPALPDALRHVEAAPPGSGRILIAGDSTAQTYGPERYPQAGWGQFLQCGLTDGARVINRATAARSTRTFITEGRWAALLAESRPGDTVLIQFGHNDAARDRPERFADATTTFRDNLLRMVWEARGRRLAPVLLTPVARRSFWDDGRSRADFAEWSAVTRAVAAQTGTPLLDLEGLSRQLVDQTGADASRRFYLHYPAGTWPAFPAGIVDNTHFSEIGARRMADLVAGALASLPVPGAALVSTNRPDLARAEPLGRTECH